MVSKAYFTHFINQNVCDERFVSMAKIMGMEDASEPMDFITELTKMQELALKNTGSLNPKLT